MKTISRPTKPIGTAPKSATRMGNNPGGGIGSRVVRPTGVRNGTPAKGLNPGGVSQGGEALGNHVTDGSTKLPYRGEPVRNNLTPAGGMVKLGNEVATNVGKGGPGAGREVFKTGSQGQCGPTRSPNASGRDILSGFGPDSKR